MKIKFWSKFVSRNFYEILNLIIGEISRIAASIFGAYGIYQVFFQKTEISVNGVFVLIALLSMHICAKNVERDKRIDTIEKKLGIEAYDYFKMDDEKQD